MQCKEGEEKKEESNKHCDGPNAHIKHSQAIGQYLYFSSAKYLHKLANDSIVVVQDKKKKRRIICKREGKKNGINIELAEPVMRYIQHIKSRLTNLLLMCDYYIILQLLVALFVCVSCDKQTRIIVDVVEEEEEEQAII